MRKTIEKAAKHQRKWYGKWHTWAGISAGFILIIVSLTGSLLVFENEIDTWLNPELFGFEQKGDRLSFQTTVEKLKKDHPEYDIQGIFLWEKRNNAYMVYLKDSEQQIIVNPYTAKVTGTRVYRSTFMGFTRHLHRTLFIPQVGKYLVGTSSLICVILMITGLRLWIPKQMKHIKSRLSVKWSAGAKRINLDLHNTLGIYFSPVITLISMTGVAITFAQFIFLFLFLLSFQSPKSISSIFNQKSEYSVGAKQLTINELQAIAEKQIEGGKLMGFNFPPDSLGTFNMNLLSPGASKEDNRSIFWIDQYSGNVVYSSENENLKLGKAYLNWVTSIHYGTFGGLPTRILALIGSLATAALFITGFIIWIPRWRKANRKKANAQTTKEKKEWTTISQE